MTRIDTATEESIRRWPVWFARLANRVIGWTDEYCTGGCGYPVTRRFTYELEKIDGVSVMMTVCSVDSECYRKVEQDPRDEFGNSYADFRPSIVGDLKAQKANGEESVASVRISFDA